MSGARSAEDRWRHAWGAFVLGAIAVIALGLIAFVLTTSPVHSHDAAPPLLLTEVPSSTSAAPTTSTKGGGPTAGSSSAASTAAAPSTTAAPSPSTTQTPAPSTPVRVVVRRSHPAPQPVPGPCGASSPCVVDGSGEIQPALAAYRQQHGADGDVPAAVTPAAQQCAKSLGDGTSCTDPFAVARERQQSGHLAVGDIGAGYGNWLLDPDLRTVEVGWAYDPPTGQYVCVLIART